MGTEIPVVDLTADDAPAAIDDACRRVGFFVATGHGVPEAVGTAARAAASRFFALPLERKLAVRAPGNPYGYEPMSHEALSRTRDGADASPAGDPKETLNIGPPSRGPDSGFGAYERLWPTEPYELRITWLAYYAEMERLATTLLGMFARAMDRPVDHFDTYVDRHLSAMRALSYPASVPGGSLVRAGAHTDYGTLTILRPDPEVGGLEVQATDGSWMELPSVPQGFVINIGDLMHRWTNGRWRSTLHRVVSDPRGRARSSMAFFHNPNWDAVIEPILEPGEAPRFEPVVAGPWLRDKFRRATA